MIRSHLKQLVFIPGAIALTGLVMLFRAKFGSCEIWVIPPAGKSVDLSLIGTQQAAHGGHGRVARLEVRPGQPRIKVSSSPSGDARELVLDVDEGDRTWVIPVNDQCLVQINVSYLYARAGRAPQLLGRHKDQTPMKLENAGHYGTDLDLFPDSFSKKRMALLVAQVPCDQIDSPEAEIFRLAGIKL